MTAKALSLLSLSDADLLLMLSVKTELLRDPNRWCHEMRAHIRATHDGPKTSEEADALFATMARLRAEANGE